MNAGFSALAGRTKEPPISWLMKLTLERPALISLAAGFTDNESLPVTATREIADKLLASAKTGRRALQYGSTAGDLELRRLTAKRLAELDRREYEAGDILITHGSQQLLYLVSECLCDPGDIVLVEDPTYFVFLGIAQSLGFTCRGIRMEHDGLGRRTSGAALGSVKEIRRHPAREVSISGNVFPESQWHYDQLREEGCRA